MRSEHDVLMEDPKFRELFAIESAVAEAAGLIAQAMAERGVSKADLAKRLGKSRAWVTQLLSGENNVTIRTLAQVLHVLGQELRLEQGGSKWGGRKTRSMPEQRGVLMKMTGKLVMQPGVDAEDFFQLSDDQARVGNEETSDSEEGDPTRPRYAA